MIMGKIQKRRMDGGKKGGRKTGESNEWEGRKKD